MAAFANLIIGIAVVLLSVTLMFIAWAVYTFAKTLVEACMQLIDDIMESFL